MIASPRLLKVVFFSLLLSVPFAQLTAYPSENEEIDLTASYDVNNNTGERVYHRDKDIQRAGFAVTAFDLLAVTKRIRDIMNIGSTDKHALRFDAKLNGLLSKLIMWFPILNYWSHANVAKESDRQRYARLLAEYNEKRDDLTSAKRLQLIHLLINQAIKTGSLYKLTNLVSNKRFDPDKPHYRNRALKFAAAWFFAEYVSEQIRLRNFYKLELEGLALQEEALAEQEAAEDRAEQERLELALREERERRRREGLLDDDEEQDEAEEVASAFDNYFESDDTIDEHDSNGSGYAF